MNKYFVEQENQKILKTGLEFWLQHFDSVEKIVPPHIHSAIELISIKNGNFKIISDGTEFTLSSGDLVLFRPHTIHQVFPLENRKSSYYVIKLKPSFIFDMSSSETGATYLLNLSIHSSDSKYVWTKDECESKGINKLIHRLEKESIENNYCYDISMKIAAAELILSLLRDTQNRAHNETDLAPSYENLAKRIYNATVFINKNFSNDITAEEASKLVFMSYSYFSRSFKHVTGKTFKDYLNDTRINHAEKALLSTSDSITKIASDCGFNSVSYFISNFKKAKGQSPSKFREKFIKSF